MTRYLLIICVVVWSASATAQLQWEATEIEIEPEAGQRWIKVAFVYTNVGGYPLTVTRIRAQHPRLTYDWLAKSRTIAPGTSGILEVTYRNSGIAAVIDAELEVTTDETGVEPSRLMLSLLPQGETQRRLAAVQLNEAREAWEPPYRIEPQVLSWTLGEDLGPKTVEIKAVGEAELPVEFELAGQRWTTGRHFEHVVEVVEPRKHLRVTITPQTSDGPVWGVLSVSGWSDQRATADPLLADPYLVHRHGLRLIMLPKSEYPTATSESIP